MTSTRSRPSGSIDVSVEPFTSSWRHQIIRLSALAEHGTTLPNGVGGCTRRSRIEPPIAAPTMAAAARTAAAASNINRERRRPATRADTPGTIIVAPNARVASASASIASHRPKSASSWSSVGARSGVVIDRPPRPGAGAFARARAAAASARSRSAPPRSRRSPRPGTRGRGGGQRPRAARATGKRMLGGRLPIVSLVVDREGEIDDGRPDPMPGTDSLAHDDPVEPRAEAFGIGQGPTLAPGAFERGLHRILRLVDPMADESCEADQPRVMLDDERLEAVGRGSRRGQGQFVGRCRHLRPTNVSYPYRPAGRPERVNVARNGPRGFGALPC
jgi:hypothetical protein